MVAVEATDVQSKVVDNRKLQVIEDAGTEVEFDEDGFVKAVDFPYGMVFLFEAGQGVDDSKKVHDLQKFDRTKDDARMLGKTVTGRETAIYEYQAQVSNSDAVTSRFVNLMTGGQDLEQGLKE